MELKPNIDSLTWVQTKRNSRKLSEAALVEDPVLRSEPGLESPD